MQCKNGCTVPVFRCEMSKNRYTIPFSDNLVKTNISEKKKARDRKVRGIARSAGNKQLRITYEKQKAMTRNEKP